MIGLNVLIGLVVFSICVTANEVELDEDNYIVGGKSAASGQFPHLVSLRTLQNQHFCGGFILSDRWIGTTAHCTSVRVARPITNVYVVTGAHTLTDGVRYRAARRFGHPLYNVRNHRFNIGVIETQNRIIFNSRTRPIQWPTGPAVHNGQTVYLAGWGLAQVSSLSANHFKVSILI